MFKKVLFTALFLSVFLGLYGEEYFIEKIDISVTGITNEKSLLRVTELKEGQVFSSLKAMDNTLTIVKNELDDTRIFKTVDIERTVLSSEGERIPVLITITVEDSWNLIALPYPKYDSNDGFEFSLRARDYNFLGLMEPLRLNLNYAYDENQKHNFGAELTYALNFPIGKHIYNLSYSQSFNYTPEESYGDDFYMGSGLSFGTSVILPWDIYAGNHIRYSLSTSVSKDYIPMNQISEYRDDVELGFSQSVSLGQVSWGNNNYRDGVVMSIDNDWTYDIDDDRGPEQAWDGTLSGEVQFHRDMYPMGYSGRIGAVRDLRDRSNIEGPFRGILERDDLEARSYVYFNNALYITVWNNKNFWEIMGGPCLDLGYLWDVPEDQDRVVWSLAVDGLCYPAFAKSFQARITIGMSGNGFMDSSGEAFSKVRKNLEMTFGLGKFY